MESLQRKLVSLAIAVVVGVLFSSIAAGQSILSEDWEKFLKEKVSFGGFVENTSGLSISHGSRFFNTSNRFIMNRFTIQPEFNVDFSEKLKLFLAWKFVAEPPATTPRPRAVKQRCNRLEAAGRCLRISILSTKVSLGKRSQIFLRPTDCT